MLLRRLPLLSLLFLFGWFRSDGSSLSWNVCNMGRSEYDSEPKASTSEMGLHGSTCMWTEEQFSEHLLRQISSRESKLRTWRNLAVGTFSHCLVEEWDEVTGPASLQPLAGQGLNQGSRVPTRAVLLVSPHHTVGERSKAWRDCSLQSHKLPSQLTHSKSEKGRQMWVTEEAKCAVMEGPRQTEDCSVCTERDQVSVVLFGLVERSNKEHRHTDLLWFCWLFHNGYPVRFISSEQDPSAYGKNHDELCHFNSFGYFI